MTDGIDDEDEVLLAMAASLGKLIKHVGGSNHAHCLLSPLELLLTVGTSIFCSHNGGRCVCLYNFPPHQRRNTTIEESTVRDAACASAQIVAESLPPTTFQNEYAAMVERLSTKEWFTARISAAALITSAFPKFTADQQTQLLTNFTRLCKDDTPMVRRVAAQYLGQMVRNVVNVSDRSCLSQTGTVTTLLIPLYEELASNEQPVRSEKP